MKGASKQQFKVLVGILKVSRETNQNVDLDELIESLTPTPTKEAIQFVIRALIKKGFIEKLEPELRRKRKRICYKLTEEGLISLDPTRRKVLEQRKVEVPSGVGSEESLDKLVESCL